jgi:hypothetical protein
MLYELRESDMKRGKDPTYDDWVGIELERDIG